MKLKLLIFGCVALWFNQAWAQNTPKNDQLLLKDFLKGIEQYTSYKVYFDSAWIEGVYIPKMDFSLGVKEQLDAAFQSTNLTYYQDKQSIIVLNGQKLITTFSESKEEISIQKSFLMSNDLENTEENLEQIVFGNLKNQQSDKVVLSGYVVDFYQKEYLTGVTVLIDDTHQGTTTDLSGFYRLELTPGKHEITYNFVGMVELKKNITIYQNARLDLEMKEKVTSLNEVVIRADYDNVNDNQTGYTALNIETIKSLPSLGGEVDVMKSSLSLPGVQTVGEGASGFNVRGGATSQNLVIMEDITIYNSSHLFGFFSIFNPDLVRDVKLYKSGFKPSYGGRISSIFDVSLKDGNRKEFHASGGISPLTGRISVEGPIKKDTTSFILGYRTTYSNWIYSFIDDSNFRNNKASFQDLTAKVSHRFNESQSLNVQSYYSTDKFNLATDTIYSYQNIGLSARFERRVNQTKSISLSGAWSAFNFEVENDVVEENAFLLKYRIDEFKIKWITLKTLSSTKTLEYGTEAIGYHLNPGQINPNNPNSIVAPKKLESENGIENAIHANIDWVVTPKLSASFGVRLSSFTLLGPNTLYRYFGERPEKGFESDSIEYGSEFINGYWGPEVRMSGRYLLSKDVSVKASYDLTRQSIHMLSNSAALSPTDSWRLSDTYLKPQIGSQLSLGIYNNFASKKYTFSVESYYKLLHSTLVPNDFAKILLHDYLETEVSTGTGRSYGFEIFLRKLKGKATGWIAYTYSRTFLKSRFTNGGMEFAADYDIPHSFDFIFNYTLSRRISLSTNITYKTGRPYTSPAARFNFGNEKFTYFSGKNTARNPNYFRCDISVNIEGNHKLDKLAHGSWAFSIYNLTGRNNIFSTYFQSEGNKINSYQLSIFNRMIPTITYNFKI